MKTRNAVLFLVLALWLGWCGRDGARLNGQTKISLDQIRGATTLAKLLLCQGATGPASDCTGLYYVELRRPDGSTLKLLGTLAPSDLALNAQTWSVAP